MSYLVEILPGNMWRWEDERILGHQCFNLAFQVLPFTKIVQEWRLKSWPAGVSSHVTITIKQTKEDTKIAIKQKGVPAKEV